MGGGWIEGGLVFSGSVPECVQRVVDSIPECTGRPWSAIERSYLDMCDDYVAYRFMAGDSHYIDQDCNFYRWAQPAEVCDSFTIYYICSPISLVWDESSEKQAAVLSTFDLEPGAENRWYVWRASSAMPLLVYDPSHEGRIDSATQLFGNWTFGGKGAASLSGSPETAPRSWANGYEALATLDINRDGKISGDELVPLALWFDDNQNGKSEKGEVKSLEEAGVVTLYYRPDSKDPVTQDVHASIGYERITGGKLHAGSSVDWFSAGYSSAAETLLALQAHASVTQEQRVEAPAVDVRAPAAAARPGSPLNGAWLWTSEDQSKLQAQGILTLKEGDAASISGHSYIEMRFTRPIAGKADRLIVKQSLSGAKKSDDRVETSFAFSIFDPDTRQKTESKARYLKSEDKIIGESVALIPLGDRGGTAARYSYTWTAKRAGAKSK